MKTKRNFFAVVLVALLALATVTTVMAADVNVVIDGTQVQFADQGPVIIDGRTLVPVRGVFEQLGFEVEWIEETREVVLLGEDAEVVLAIDSNVFTTNGVPFTLDVPAQIVGDRTVVPIRFVLESVGFIVGWDDISRNVYVLTTDGAGGAFAPAAHEFSDIVATFDGVVVTIGEGSSISFSGNEVVIVQMYEELNLPSYREYNYAPKEFTLRGTFALRNSYIDFDFLDDLAALSIDHNHAFMYQLEINVFLLVAYAIDTVLGENSGIGSAVWMYTMPL